MKVDMMKADAMKGSGMPGKIGVKGSWALAVQIIAVTASQNLLIAAPQTLAEPTAYERLFKEFDAANDAHRKKLREARKGKDQERIETLLKKKIAADFVERFQAGADAHRGQPESKPYLLWLASHGRYGVRGAEAAVARLVTEFVRDKELGSLSLLIYLMVDREGYDRQLGLSQLMRIATVNVNAENRAAAHFWRAEILGHIIASEEAIKQALVDLEQVQQISQVENLRTRARNFAYELTHLRIGLPAPEIEAEDLDGVVFKLSDYRGKVVLLDFWGHW